MASIFSNSQNALFIVAALAGILFLAVIVSFVNSLFVGISETLMPSLNEESQAVLEDGVSNYSPTFDFVIIMFFLVIMLVMFASSFFFSYNNFFLALMIFIMFVSVFSSFYLQDWWIDNVATDPTLLPEDSIPMTNWVLTNLSMVMSVLVFFNGIVIFLGRGRVGGVPG